MKYGILSFLKAAISLVLLGLLFYMKRESLPQILEAIEGLKPWSFFLSIAIFMLGICMLAGRLMVLLSAQGIPVHYTGVLYLTFIGHFFNNFLPTAVGGDLVKAYYASKHTQAPVKSVISIIMDRMLGMFTLFVLAGISVVFCYQEIQDKTLIVPIVAILSVLVALFALLLTGRLKDIGRPFAGIANFMKITERLKEIYNAVDSFKNKKHRLFQALLISIAAQVVFFAIISILSDGLGIILSLKIVFLFMPLVSIASMLPSINGLGIRENAIYFLYGPYVGYDNALVLSLLWLLMMLSSSAIGGAWYFFSKEKGVIRCQRSW